MPSLRNRLNEAKIKSLKEKGWYLDGAGLYLQVTGPTAKSWVYRYSKQGKEHRLGLGPYPTVELKSARLAAAGCRKLLEEGEDLKAHLKTRRSPGSVEHKEWDFEACAEAYMEAQRDSWSNPKHAQQWKNTLTHYAYPYIGQLNIDSVTTNDVVDCLQPIWAEKTETAKRLRQRIESVFDWARAKGFRKSQNPAIWKGLIENILPNPKRLKEARHHPYMKVEQVPDFYAWLSKKNTVSSLSLRFLLLTAARNGESRGALWSEIDHKDNIWSLPPTRMKTRKLHTVPLSSEAQAILEAAKPFSTGDNVFSLKQDTAISETSLRKVLRSYIQARDIEHCVLHGFRSTFRIWAEANSNLGFAILETALSHRKGDSVQSAYLDNKFIEERRDLMELWSKYLTSEVV